MEVNDIMKRDERMNEITRKTKVLVISVTSEGKEKNNEGHRECSNGKVLGTITLTNNGGKKEGEKMGGRTQQGNHK